MNTARLASAMIAFSMALAVSGLDSVARAQDMGAAPAVATATSATGASATATTGSAAATPMNIYSLLCPTAQQAAALKAKLCKCCLVKLLDAGLAPARAFTGGCLEPCCPTGPTPEQLAMPASSAEGAAARVKQCELGAPGRISAVRYLATAPCQRFPEAELALLTALRTDCSDCVRAEAAKALGSGCCCSKKVIASLLLVVNGGTSDGNPKECSDRVRVLAFQALYHCLQLFCESAPVKPPEPSSEKPAEGKPGPAAAIPVGELGVMPASQVLFYRRVEQLQPAELIAVAKQTLTYGPAKELVMNQPARSVMQAANPPASVTLPRQTLAPPIAPVAPVAPMVAPARTPAPAEGTPKPARSLFGAYQRATNQR